MKRKSAREGETMGAAVSAHGKPQREFVDYWNHVINELKETKDTNAIIYDLCHDRTFFEDMCMNYANPDIARMKKIIKNAHEQGRN